MPGLFDRLKAELGDDEPAGVTPLEIADLPDNQRRILLWLLRDRTAASEGVTAAVVQARLDEAPENCDSILRELAKGGWVIVMGEAPQVRYKVNLRRKRGSNMGFGLWSIISDRVSTDPNDT
jgi:hypothetical protein